MDQKLQFSHTFFETALHILNPPTTPIAIEFYSQYWQWLKQATLDNKDPLFTIPNLQSHLHLMDHILPALVQLNHAVIGGFQSSARGAKRWFKVYENATGLERARLMGTEECFGISFEALELRHVEKLEALERELEVLIEINGAVEDLLLVRKILEHAKKPLGEAVKGVVMRKDGIELLVG
ncbi:hypothetical protein P7C71_g2697, partial [Lecanoromycetidae sp. Uapishka_2]